MVKSNEPLTLFIRNLLFTLVVPGTVGVYLPLRIVESTSPTRGLVFVIACIIIFLGTVIYLWCVWDFAVFGRGTPAPIDAPRKLVIRGFYRYTRNPMYIGVLTVILGWAILFGNTTLLLYDIAVGICFHLFIVMYEERYLQREFGKEYDDYCARVNRWIPKLGAARRT